MLDPQRLGKGLFRACRTGAVYLRVVSTPNPLPATKHLSAILRRARARREAVEAESKTLWETCQQLQLLLQHRVRSAEALRVPAVLREALGLLEDLAPGWDLGRPLAAEFYGLIDPACQLDFNEGGLDFGYRTALHSLLLSCMVLHVHFGQVNLALRNGLTYLQSEHAEAFRSTFQVTGEAED